MDAPLDPDIQLRGNHIVWWNHSIQLGKILILCFSVSCVYFFVGGREVYSQTGWGSWPDLSPWIRHCTHLSIHSPFPINPPFYSSVHPSIHPHFGPPASPSAHPPIQSPTHLSIRPVAHRGGGRRGRVATSKFQGGGTSKGAAKMVKKN